MGPTSHLCENEHDGQKAGIYCYYQDIIKMIMKDNDLRLRRLLYGQSFDDGGVMLIVILYFDE